MLTVNWITDYEHTFVNDYPCSDVPTPVEDIWKTVQEAAVWTANISFRNPATASASLSAANALMMKVSVNIFADCTLKASGAALYVFFLFLSARRLQ